MSSFEFNKIFAALLCAGITMMLAGFIANKVMVPEKLEKDVVAIDGGAVDTGPIDTGPKLPDPIMGLLADANTGKGAKLSKACAACHSFEKGGPVKQGPNLWNVVGAPMASKEGFAYSDALANKGGNWDYDALNKFLKSPKKYIPGTKMNFAGLRKVEDRADLVAWLRLQADDPAPLPSEEEIAAEQAAFAPPAPAEETAEDVAEGADSEQAAEGDDSESAESASDKSGDAASEPADNNESAH